MCVPLGPKRGCSGRTRKPKAKKEEKKVIIPQKGKFVLSQDGHIRVGKHSIGCWIKEVVATSMHYRPSQYEGKTWYHGKLWNNESLSAWSKTELREQVVELGASGIEIDEDE